ncbi:hypothetical protein [Demequina globuliformis]|uniref:hypothetical protein n=1 Tax=Demequina globuliformis TaxID=676202 RepID=UPI000783F8D8|nr:hypothetical protein [Demequina globuliformis]
MTAQAQGRSRQDKVKIGLAGIAILGIGAAVTTAAWTDDVWFTSQAEAAQFDLQGSLDGVDWQDVGVDSIDGMPGADESIEIPASEFAGLVPDDSRTVTVHLQNAGDTDIALAEAVPALTGDLFVADAAPLDTPATVTVGDFASATLAPGAETTFDITVATPEDWGTGYMGATGSLSVSVVGTATAS